MQKLIKISLGVYKIMNIFNLKIFVKKLAVIYIWDFAGEDINGFSKT